MEGPSSTSPKPLILSPTLPTEISSETAMPTSPKHCVTLKDIHNRKDGSHENAQNVIPEQGYFKVIDSESKIIQVQSINKQKAVDLTTVDDRPMLYKVHPPQVSEPIQALKLPEAFSELPFVGFVEDKEDLLMAQRRKIKEFIGDDLSNEQFERLELYCSPENLRLGNELKIKQLGERDFGFDYMDIAECGGNREAEGDSESLQTIKKYKLRIELDERNIYPRKLKYRGLRHLPLRDDFLPAVSAEEALVPGKDLLIRIRVHRPFEYNPRDSNVFSIPSISRCPIFAYDIILTGRHTLTAIRDAISCINENNLRVDISKNHKTRTSVTCETLFPSGFLFINNAFYNDQRQNCKDLSGPIVQWARKHKLGEFPTFPMDTRLDAITIKLGYPDVYVHQGDCEHTFSFADIRLVTASDPLSPAAYPTQTFLSNSHEAYCTTCADKIATRLVVNCVRVPFDPAFMCDTCYDLYLYDKDGKKNCNFVAYNYVK